MEQLKSGPKESLMMPGPKFKKKGGWWSKFFKNRSNIVLVVIAILIIAGGVYLYSNYQKSGQMIGSESESSQENEEEGMIKPEQIKLEEAQSEEIAEPQTEKAEVVEKAEAKIVVQANKGAGVTHLSRKALEEYLKLYPETGQNLTPEHKIYIEDYLKDETGSFPLEVGQELTFSEDLIKEAIDSSQELTEGQLENLHKYVLLVPSLSA